MKLVADTHCHTISSGHAYSTIQEIAAEASRKGVELIAMTDHAPAMPGGAHRTHFDSIGAIPDELYGVRVLKGCEANILDYEGKIDLKDRTTKRLDLVIASLHLSVLKAGSIEENTNALVQALKNPFIDVVGHPENPRFPVDFETVIKTAKEYNKLVEMNNGSFYSRKGCEDNCMEVALLAKKHGVKITTGSDTHFSYSIGELDIIREILESVDMPEELVVTTKKGRLLSHLREHGRRV